MDPQRIQSLQAGYDQVADDYVQHIYGELAHKPFDREGLDAFAEGMREDPRSHDTRSRDRKPGPILDVGCGPGHVARYLRDRGVDVCGLDLSEGMLAHARRLNPDITFVQGDMTALADPDETWAGIVAFYSLIHIPRAEVVRGLAGLKRVLRPGGPLFMAFHIGDEDLHVEDLWGHAVSLEFTLFQPQEMAGYLRSAGFAIDSLLERDPYPDVEYQSRRCYILARKPTGNEVS
jgi:SAM-dependent methyltransferase